jgi:hypothetical protein
MTQGANRGQFSADCVVLVAPKITITDGPQ